MGPAGRPCEEVLWPYCHASDRSQVAMLLLNAEEALRDKGLDALQIPGLCASGQRDYPMTWLEQGRLHSNPRVPVPMWAGPHGAVLGSGVPWTLWCEQKPVCHEAAGVPHELQ